MIKLSPQQEDIMAWVESGEGSAFVEAVAGSGKTTTLLEACQRMNGNVSLCAFNKKIADEINYRLKPLNVSNVRAATFHSFGYSAWRFYLGGKVNVDARQKNKLMHKELEVPSEYYGAVTKLVSLAKQNAVGKLWQPDDDEAWREIIYHHSIDAEFDRESHVDHVIMHAKKCIEWSRRVGQDLIDFDDMIWLPITTNNITFFQSDWVLVDESQDTNAARRIMASMMLKNGGRSLWVGDRSQAIYGFTGADYDAIDVIEKDFGCVSLPLTVTYRCPKSVVRVAQKWVNHIEAHESAPEGIVQTLDRVDFEEEIIPRLSPKDAVLCRNTKPLVELAFQMIRQGIGCHVEGRDIGQGLISLATQWKKVKTVEELLEHLEAFREREIKKIIARGGDDYAMESINDRIDTLIVITEGCELVAELVSKINSMFRDTNGKPSTVTLSTIHKAKGREWDLVTVLGFDIYMPSRYARQEWQQQQERNLMYVAVTRTKKELILQVGK